MSVVNKQNATILFQPLVECIFLVYGYTSMGICSDIYNIGGFLELIFWHPEVLCGLGLGLTRFLAFTVKKPRGAIILRTGLLKCYATYG